MEQPKDVKISVDNTPKSPERVYFFQRPDGSKIHVDSNAAWHLYSRPQQTMSGPVKHIYLGTSDGRQYNEAVREAQTIFKDQGLEAAQERIRQGWEAELEIALQDKTPPVNTDTVDRSGNPVSLNDLR